MKFFDTAKGYVRKGDSLLPLGRFKEAQQAFEKALECEPNNEFAKKGAKDGEMKVQKVFKNF